MQHASLRADTEGEHRQITSGRPRGNASPSASRRAVKPVHDTVLRAGPGLELGQPSRRLGVHAVASAPGSVLLLSLPCCPSAHHTEHTRPGGDPTIISVVNFKLQVGTQLLIAAAARSLTGNYLAVYSAVAYAASFDPTRVSNSASLFQRRSSND